MRVHDTEQCEIHCYAEVSRPDHATSMLRAFTDRWSCINGVRDQEVAEGIGRDPIGILVDLAGHTAHHRLGVGGALNLHDTPVAAADRIHLESRTLINRLCGNPLKISAFEIRVGGLIEHQGKLWRVLKKNHVKPGKGGAFVQVELKDITGGTKLNERFRSVDTVEKAYVEPRQMLYLYADGDNLVFMDNETFEQMHITREDLGDQIGFLLPNTEVQVNFHNEVPIGVDLPANVVLEVVDTEGVIKGQTATGSGKPAELETGLKVTVPPFVNVGDKVKINTDSGEYVERA